MPTLESSGTPCREWVRLKRAPAAIANTFAQFKTTMNKKLNVGLIGAGRIANVHAETIAFGIPQATLLAVADINRKAAEDLAARCGILRVAASADDIIRDPEIERSEEHTSELQSHSF